MIIGLDASRAVTAQRTGTEAYAYFLIRALIPLAAARGHRLRLYFNQPPPPEMFPSAEHVELVNIPQRRLWSQARLAWELRRRPPDLFFTPAHVIPFAFRGASVATVHDLGYHHFPDAHTRRQLLYLKLTTRTNGRISRRVIADSHATKTDLMRFYAIPSAKIDVIYPGLDPALRPVTDAAALAAAQRKYGVNSPYLLTLGTLQPRKNLARLVEAYAASGVQPQLVLAGKAGWLAEPLHAAIAALPEPVRARVRLPGFVADEDKAALLSGATALLYPSLYEGFGFPLLEAQACATAVLASASSSLPEIAGGGALLVDPQNTQAIAHAIRRLTEEAGLRAALVDQGRRNVRRFTWEATAVQVMRTLEKAAQ
jgi:glycosyltransferase involved in cell wall biosynthesis